MHIRSAFKEIKMSAPENEAENQDSFHILQIEI